MGFIFSGLRVRVVGFEGLPGVERERRWRCRKGVVVRGSVRRESGERRGRRKSKGSDGDKRDLNVVLCHVTADYDTLAAAVGLAKIRGGNTVVVLSGGSNPSVEKFLNLFQPMFPVRSPKAVNPERIKWIGVVDCSRKDRLGKCAQWVELAESVEVYDHHGAAAECDLVNEKGGITLFEEEVGAATTMIVERLRDGNVHISQSEATLMALGIHSDTGSLLFDCTGPRDVRALAWLLECGANLKAVVEYKSSDLSGEHLQCLNEGLRALKKEKLKEVVFGHCIIETGEFIKGLSRVAQSIIELTEIDVLMFTVVNDLKQKKKEQNEPLRKQISAIGRSRPLVKNVDLGEVLSRWGGGGHARAAALTIRTERDPMEIVEDILDAVRDELMD
ncbi:hypothetical protein NDN08_001298 [Rhodosorus marinus]|uniref:DHHA2 domain-containing protein n=1 Tax=Rhodosorus marinus TaxID=101924 RepID=A0AAV8UT73_9RHOD|nr:hypothetical protein NDN08_001298 [Rhodosorus marinus]